MTNWISRKIRILKHLVLHSGAPKNLTHIYMYALTSIAVLALAFNAIKFGIYSEQTESIKAIRQVERQLVQTDRLYNQLLELQLSSTWKTRNKNLKEAKETVVHLLATNGEMKNFSILKENCDELNCSPDIFTILPEILNTDIRLTNQWMDGSQVEVKSYRDYLENINTKLDEITSEANSQLITLDVVFLVCLMFFLIFQAAFIFRPAVSRLDHALSIRSDFLSRISHEIRNPMNSILGMAEVLRGTRLNLEQKQYLNSLLRAGQTLLEMLNNLIDVAAVEGKKIQLKPTLFETIEMVDKTSQIVSSTAHQKGIEFFVKIDPRVRCAYVADVSRLEQVLINLLNNAVKFTPKGYILLELELLSEMESSSCLRFSVKDTGIGIEKSKTHEIFNSFVQEDSSIKRQYGGSGLGLSIAAEILTLMGSQLHVESDKGIGSTFFFDLELQHSPTIMENRKSLDLQKPIVLVTSQFSKVMHSILSQTFSTCWICETEKELRDLLNQIEEPIYVVVDDSVGIINMISISDCLKELSRKDILGALLKTSFPKENIDLIRKAGYSNFMLKPFRKWVLESFGQEEEAETAENRLSTQPKYALKVLAVDDSEDNLFLIREILSPYVNKIDFASNGQEAVSMVRSKSYDIVLMDIQMPVMDGYTAIRQIRKIDEKNIPVVAVTAHGGVIDEKKCLEAGFSARLVKPISRDQLLHVIEDFYGHMGRELKEEQKEPMDPMIAKLLPTFFATRESDLNFVEKALKEKDFERLKALGHKMKGSSLSYGFEEMGSKGKALEEAALSHDLATCEKLYHEIRKNVNEEKERHSIH